MKFEKLLYLFLPLTLSAAQAGWAQTDPGNAPVITHSFAVDKGSYGYIWKTYLEAEDLDGDMDKKTAYKNVKSYCMEIPSNY